MSVLKNITAYYIQFKDESSISPGKLEKVFTGFEDLCVKILDEDDSKFIASQNSKYDGSGYDFLYLFFEDYKIKSIIDYLVDNGVVDSHKDVTSDIITGDIYDIEDFKKVYYGFDESIKLFEDKGLKYVPEFKKTFDEFILKNVTTDNILDKINEKGIEYLTDIDKEILKNG